MSTLVEVLSTDTDRLNSVAKEANIHALALEDLTHRDQRPKLDDYGTHQLLVWFVLCKGRVHELQFVILSDRLLLVPHSPPPEGESWQSFLRLSLDGKDVWHQLYQVLDRTTDLTWIELRALYKKVDDFEQKMFKTGPPTDIWNAPRTLLSVKRQIIQLDYSIGHQASVAKQIQNLCQPKDDLQWKWRDLFDHCERIQRSMELYRNQIATTIDLYWGLEANRTNAQIKKLTLLASISVPLTFWASFWGMNFEVIPFSDPRLFLGALGLMALSVAVTGYLLIKKGYWQI